MDKEPCTGKNKTAHSDRRQSGKGSSKKGREREHPLCPFRIHVRLRDIHRAERSWRKTNEIPEIPRLLDLMDITDCTVTIDAVGTQKDIMDKTIDKGGHFCLQLKKNQRTAFEDMDLFFRDLEEKNRGGFQKLSSYTETAKNHGRIEKQEYYTFASTEEIKRMMDTRWEHVKCIDMARLTRTIRETTTEVHYHLNGGKIYGTGAGTLGNRKQLALGF